MCGICGKLAFSPQSQVGPELIRAMADTMVHRGPDDEGYFVSGAVGLGFRRLSIIDLNTGQQPISNEDGRVWVVFNGEIYNYQELRRDLVGKGHVFRTQSDTEVIVHLYEELGEACVEKLRGMFAFAVWDDRTKSLMLARDRVGIKPLYYWVTRDSLIFGSEMKAILADPETKREVLPEMIDRFLSFGYVPGEETLLRNIRKLGAGYYLVARDGNVRTKQYWDLSFTTVSRTYGQAESELMELLEESVGLHMISDVPVGVLLSGGVDSTALLGIAAGTSQHPLSSYTLGFSAPGITDERPYARAAAQRYGSDHHEMTITSRDFQEFMPKYVWHMEEPICEPPAVALYYVSKAARGHVKVLLSGEGGDEAFAGYPNYRTMLWMERLKSVLGPLKGAFSAGITRMNDYSLRSRRVAGYASLLGVPFESYYYSRASGPSRFFNDRFADFYSKEFASSVSKEFSLDAVKKCLKNGSGEGWINKMLYVDTKTWLVDDLLLKADKMTMANSVELRVPLLDHKLLEFAASLPGMLKVHGFKTKYIFKKTLEKRVGREILERRKTGFPIPYEAWLRTDLRGWLLGILLDRRTLSRGYFERKSVERLAEEDRRSGGYSKELFSLAVLELWHRAFLEG